MSSTIARILLPVSRQGTTEACSEAAFGLARDFGATLEVLHPCAAVWQRLPFATELSPGYSQELVDIGREQILLEQSAAQAWFEQASRAHSGAVTHFQSVEGFVSLTMATAPAHRANLERPSS